MQFLQLKHEARLPTHGLGGGAGVGDGVGQLPPAVILSPTIQLLLLEHFGKSSLHQMQPSMRHVVQSLRSPLLLQLVASTSMNNSHNQLISIFTICHCRYC